MNIDTQKYLKYFVISNYGKFHVGVWVHCWKGQTRCKRVVKNICDDKNATQSFEKLSNKLKDIKYMQKLKDLVVDIEKSTWEKVVSNMLKTILEINN